MGKTKANIISFQIYFLLMAVCKIYLSLKTPNAFDNMNSIMIATIIMDLAMTGACFYIGIFFKKLLVKLPQFIYGFILINVAMILGSTVFLFGYGGDTGRALLTLIFKLLLNWYVYHEVKKLVNELQPINPAV